MLHYLTFLMALGAAWHLQAAEIFVVVLPAAGNFTGNSYAFEPFSGGVGGTNSIRYQQVFTPLGLSPYGPAVHEYWLSGMVFRTDEGTGLEYAGSIDFQVNLSTTSRDPDALSTVFAENTGPDDTTVFPRIRMSMFALPHGGSYSTPIIQFAEPFYYDSHLGNLLLDVRFYRGDPFAMPLAGLDAVDTANDDTSRVFANSVNATSGTADTKGIVVGFYVTPIPEPATWALLACGAAFSTLLLRRRSHLSK